MDNGLFSTAMMLTDKVVAQVNEANLHKPTPCTEWDVEKLTNHMLVELVWLAPLLEGKTIAEVGSKYDGDLLNGDAGAAWLQYCREASAAMQTADPAAMAHLSYADKSNQAYVDEVAADIIVHGWDLAQALGVEYMLDDKTCDAVLAAAKDVLPMAREGGMVAPEVTVDQNSSKMEKLLAAYGRSTN